MIPVYIFDENQRNASKLMGLKLKVNSRRHRPSTVYGFLDKVVLIVSSLVVPLQAQDLAATSGDAF